MNIPLVMLVLYILLPVIHMICTLVLLKIVKREEDPK